MARPRAEVPAFRSSGEHFARASGILLIESEDGGLRVASGRQRFKVLKDEGVESVDVEILKPNGIRRQARINMGKVKFP